MIKTKTITFNGYRFLISNHRVLFWHEKKMLILADLHLGKTSWLRKHGMAVPEGLHKQDLDRLAQALQYFQPAVVSIVGDLFHVPVHSETEKFFQWMNAQNVEQWNLIRGNHDKISRNADWPKELRMVEKVEIGAVTMIHHHNHDETYSISGHIHPGVHLRTANKQNIKLPCFLVSSTQIILPAFSAFTGLDFSLTQSGKYDVYALTQQSILLV
ncbi:MAG: ligase-associated DNA damage response endonuclease PdeM [Bacteroidota bacterium]